MVSNVRFGSVGSNFGTFDKDSKEVLYEAKFSDGRVSSHVFVLTLKSLDCTRYIQPTVHLMGMNFL